MIAAVRNAGAKYDRGEHRTVMIHAQATQHHSLVQSEHPYDKHGRLSEGSVKDSRAVACPV